MSAPTRLLEDTSVPQKMRDDLRRTQGAVILPFDTAAGLARFRAGLDVGGGAMAPSAGAGGLLGGAGWKVLTALGVAGAIGWALLSGEDDADRGGDTGPGRGATNLRAAPSFPPAAPSPVDRTSLGEPADAASTDAAKPGEESSTTRAKAASAPPSIAAPPPPSEKSDPLADEIAHLGDLRQLHHRDPAAAVSAAQEGHVKFSSGLLYEEREALLILSLQQLGRGAEAARHIDVFRKRFPKSAFLPKMGAASSTGQEGTVKPDP